MSAAVTNSKRTRRLRPGPSRLMRDEVSHIQRARMIAATIDAVEEVGYSNLTVAHVISRARVSRKTFYDVFPDREHCFLETYQEVLDRARALAVEAYVAEPTWRDGVRAALAQLLAFMEEEPALARMCLVESLAGGERVLALRTRSLRELARAVDLGRRESARPAGPAPVTSEAIVGGILAVLRSRVMDDPHGPMTQLRGQLMSMIVLPFLGPRVARNELDAPCPKRPGQLRQRDSPGRGPLAGLKMRLTYRTIRVLMSIQRVPGSSNREVSEASGIVDAGQMSKLLNRLLRLGLIENRGPGQPKGGANEWWLTPRGLDVERVTRPR
jgi:AcrR family transcriptional regulator